MKKLQKSISGSALLLLVGTCFLLSFSYARNDHKLLVPFETLINESNNNSPSLIISNVNEKIFRSNRESNLSYSFDCPGGTAPTASVFAIQPTCTNNVANTDGYLQLSSVTDGDKVNFSTGVSYTGDTDYANATTIGALPFLFNTGLSSPSGSQDYTVRIFNGGSTCFIDVVVTMNEQDCSIGCDCDEYLYLNDTDLGEVHKFFVSTTDSTITEIGSPWMSGFDDPHGLGVDINGNFYIGDRSQGPIYQVNCDGGTVATDATLWTTAIQWDLYNIGSYDGYIITNGGGPGLGNKINVFDPCDGSLAGAFCLEGLTNDWGLQVLPDGTILVTDGGFGSATKSIYQFQYDTTLFSGACIEPFVASTDNLTLSSPLTVNGTTYNSTITLNDFGSLYGITSDGDYLYVLANSASFSTSYILKIDATTGALVDVVDETVSTNSTVGWAGALGLVYAPSSGLLYVSGYEDCISILDPADLSYIAAGAGAVGPGSNPKAVALVTECCPTNNNVTIDTTLCAASLNDRILLQELVNCNGTICEGMWEEALGNTGLTYNSCDNSVSINSLGACGTFTLASDGIGNNPQCGAFTFTVNVESLDITAPIIAGDQMVCEGEASTAFTVSTPASGSSTITYQWQSSTTNCTTDFTDITSATSDTYDAGTITQTTYYRVISSVNGGCSSGMCMDTSNCVTITYSLNPVLTALVDQTICEGANFDSNNVTTSVTNGVSVTYQWYDNDGADNTGTNMISGQTTTTLTALPTTAGTYSYRVEASNASNSSCKTNETVTLTILDLPSATAITTNATCSGATSNDDGQITLYGFNTGERYALEENSSYTGSATFASGSNAIPTNGIIATNLANPSGAKQYTIRIFNSDECFVDRIVSLNEWTCICLDPIADPSPAVICIGSIDTVYGNPTGGSGIYAIHSWTDLNTGTASGYALNQVNTENMTLDATTATEGTINLQYYVEDNVGCSTTIEHTITLTLPDDVKICDDATNYVEIVAQPGLANVVWFNSSDTQVGTGDTLVVDANTLGMGDGIDSYYYNAADATGCEAGLCCPIVVTAEDCCKPEICLPFRMTVKRGSR